MYSALPPGGEFMNIHNKFALQWMQENFVREIVKNAANSEISGLCGMRSRIQLLPPHNFSLERRILHGNAMYNCTAKPLQQ